MCTQVRCGKCGKKTWAGCGRHIEAALANVPPAERCRCADAPAEPKKPSETDPRGGPKLA